MKVKSTNSCLIDLGASILILAILYLPSLLRQFLQLPIVWVAVIAFLIIFGFIFILYLTMKSLKRTKRLLRILSLCILWIGVICVCLSYHKDVWKLAPWDPSIFGIGVAIIALGITLFFTIVHPRESEAIAIDKVIIDLNSRLQELTTETKMIDKVVKDLNNKMQQLNTKVQMMDKTAKDIDSKIQKLDTKIQMLIDKGQQKR